ncbi:MAG: transposase [Patescibacteria group bacterium]
MEYRKQAHITYRADYHLVFVTKYRRKVLKGGMREYLKDIVVWSV